MRNTKLLLGVFTCVFMTLAGLLKVDARTDANLYGGDGENLCAVQGCKPQNTVVTSTAGHNNTCNVSVDVSQGAVSGVDREGACNCLGGDCLSVESAVCRASCVFTVSVTSGSGYKFCGADAWLLTSNTATITLDSGNKSCSASGSVGEPESLWIFCGEECGAESLLEAAWLVTVRSQCYGCPAWHHNC